MQGNETARVRAYLLELQDRICTALEAQDERAQFEEHRHEGEGRSQPRSSRVATKIKESDHQFAVEHHEPIGVLTVRMRAAQDRRERPRQRPLRRGVVGMP